jgi:superfamily II DNA or RNA helicase
LQSLNERNHEILIDTDQILIDEAHSNSFYTQAEIAYRSWQWKRIINFTATPYNRSMGTDENFGSLVRNTAIVCGPTYRQLEKMGYLSPLRYHVNSNLVDGKLDLDSDEAIYQNLLKFKSTCQKLNLPHNFAVAFCKPKNKNGKAQYQTIERIARELNLPPFIHVGDGIDLETQAEAQRLFNLGEINLSCIHSLSTGWDNPRCRHVMFMRSVGSRDRAVQIATRTDRIHNSKKFGEIWDFSQTFQILGEESGLHPKVEDLSDSIDESVLQPKTKKEGEAPLKSCSNKSCKHKMHPSVMICEKCGTKQPPSSIPMVLATGDIVSFASEEIIKSDLKYSTAFFKQWRKIAYLNKWTPFSAHKKLADLGVSVGLDDSRYWLNSLEISKTEYRKYLEEYSKAWNWDSSKIDREMIREFGT